MCCVGGVSINYKDKNSEMYMYINIVRITKQQNVHEELIL